MRTTTIFAETHTSERANHVAYRLVEFTVDISCVRVIDTAAAAAETRNISASPADALLSSKNQYPIVTLCILYRLFRPTYFKQKWYKIRKHDKGLRMKTRKSNVSDIAH